MPTWWTRDRTIPNPQAPSEILDRILSFLQEDNATLSACSQSHSILSEISSCYLYVHITTALSIRMIITNSLPSSQRDHTSMHHSLCAQPWNKDYLSLIIHGSYTFGAFCHCFRYWPRSPSQHIPNVMHEVTPKWLSLIPFVCSQECVHHTDSRLPSFCAEWLQ